MRKITIKLNEQERQELDQQIRAGVRSARELTRARILLLSDQGQSSGQVAQACLCTSGTVTNVKKRYLAGGLEAAVHDKPRPGAPPKITGEVEAHLVALTCSDPPEGYGQWTLRLLADQLVELELVESVSHTAIGKVLKKTNSSPGA
jgi:transposase